MTDKKYLEMQNLGFASAMLEQILAVFKTQYFHEKKELEIKRLQFLLENAKNNKEKYRLKKEIKDIVSDYKKQIDRCEKYNNEVTKELLNSKAESLDNIKLMLDSCHTIFSDMFDIFIDVTRNCSPNNPITLFPAWLKESDKGTLFHKGYKFEILDKINC